MLKFFTNLDDSLMERLQREFSNAHLVKAFNSVGNACMIHPRFKDGRPTMFICGNDEAAKQTVGGILDQFGWEGLGPRVQAAELNSGPLALRGH